MDYLATHTSLPPIRHGFAPGFVNDKKGCTRLATTSDTVYQLLAHCRWFSPGTPASSTTKTGRRDIAEILLNVALNTNNQSILIFKFYVDMTRFRKVVCLIHFYLKLILLDITWYFVSYSTGGFYIMLYTVYLFIFPASTTLTGNFQKTVSSTSSVITNAKKKTIKVLLVIVIGKLKWELHHG